MCEFLSAARLPVHEREGVGVACEIRNEELHCDSRVALAGLLAQQVASAPDLAHRALTNQILELVMTLQDHAIMGRDRSFAVAVTTLRGVVQSVLRYTTRPQQCF